MTDTGTPCAELHVIEPPDSEPGACRVARRTRPAAGGSGSEIDGHGAGCPPWARTGSGYRHAVRANGKPVTFDDVLPGASDPAERLKAQDSDSVDAEGR